MGKGFTSFDDWFAAARADDRNNGYSDQELTYYWLQKYGYGDEPAEQPERAERTWGEAASDTGIGLLKGGANLVETAGTLYGMATGDMDNPARNAGAEWADSLQSMKSDVLQRKESEAGGRMAEAGKEGFFSGLWSGIYETASDPALLSNFIAENLAMFVPGGAAGRVAGVGARALGAAKGVEGAARTGAAYGAMAGLQGGDVGSSTYDRLMGMPDDVWAENDQFRRLSADLGADQAKHEISLNLSRGAAGVSALASLGTKFLPGGGTIEKLVAGVKGAGKGALAGAAKGFAGEALQEGLEEGSGQYASNVYARDVDPTIDPMEGVGAAAGQGAVLGGVLGAPAGGISGMAQALRESDKVLERAARDIQDDMDADSIREKALAASQVSSEVLRLGSPTSTFTDFFDAAGDVQQAPVMLQTADGLRPERVTDLQGLPESIIADRRVQSDDQARELAAVLNADAAGTVSRPFQTDPVPDYGTTAPEVGTLTGPTQPDAGPDARVPGLGAGIGPESAAAAQISSSLRSEDAFLGEESRGATPTGAIPGAGIPQTVLSDADRSQKTAIPTTSAPQQAYIPTMTPLGTFAVTRTNLTDDASSLARAESDVRAKIERLRAEGKSTGAATDFGAELAPHEMVRGGSAVVGATALMGIKTRFFKQTKGSTINGFVAADGSVWINMNAKNALMEVAIHEATHVMERTAPELYQEFLGAMEQFVSQEELSKVKGTHGALGKARKEATANVSGAAAMRPEFWKNLAEKSPNVFRRLAGSVLKFFDDLIGRLRGQKSPMARIAESQAAEAAKVVSSYLARWVEEAPARQSKAEAEAKRAAASARAQEAADRYSQRQIEEPAAEERAQEMAGEAMIAAGGQGINLKDEDYSGPKFSLTERGAPDNAERESLRMRSSSIDAKVDRAIARERQEEAIRHHAQMQRRDEEGRFSGGIDLSLSRKSESEPPQAPDRPARSEADANRDLAGPADDKKRPLKDQLQKAGWSGGANFSIAERSDFTRENIEGIAQKDGWAILTGENPNNQEQDDKANVEATNRLRSRLREDGVDYIEVRGRYSEEERPEERSFIVFADKQRAMALGVEFGQESVLTREGLIYQSGKVDKATGKVNVFDKVPENYYTRIPGEPWAFSVDIQFSVAEDAEEEADPDGLSRKTVMSAAKKIAAKLGYPEIREQTPESTATVVGRLKADVLEELGRDRGASEWYRENLKDAMRQVASVYPEVASDPFARQAFIVALAVTSNGLTIEQNVFRAFELYSEYRKDPSLGLPVRGFGVRRVNMEHALSKFNELVDIVGPDGAAEFLSTPIKAGDIKGMLGIDTKWPADYEVYGSTIFGPKIGHGFFSNLSGRYDALTMDRWFFRAWGRVTGSLIRKTKKDGKPSEKLMELQVSPGDRAFAHDAVNELVEELRAEGYSEMTAAGVQAVLWYHEKALYEANGAVYENAKPTDFATEVRRFIENHGLVAVEEFRGGRDAGERPVAREGADAEVPWDEVGATGGDIPFSVAGPSGSAARPGREGSVSAVGVHFGSVGGLPALSGSSFGRGIKGAEKERLARATDPRIRRRIYFYVAKVGETFDIKRREAGLGPHIYRADLGNLYESGVSPKLEYERAYTNKEFGILDNAENANRFESAVLDAGYDGYLVRKPDIAVVLNKDVPVRQLGTVGQGPRADLMMSLGGAESAEERFENDMRGQSEFLSDRALAAGHSSQDEFLAADPSGFMAAAAEWRKMAPRLDEAGGQLFSIDEDIDAAPAPDDDTIGPTTDFEDRIADDLARYREGLVRDDFTIEEVGRQWIEKARDPSIFAYPISFDSELDGVAYEMSGRRVKVKRRPSSSMDGEAAGFKPKVTYELMLDGKKAWVYENAKGDVVLNVALLDQGRSNGSLLYQIVGTWAANAGKRFIGDPAGLTDRAIFRRTANMLSSALRTGGTIHLAPHQRQTDAGMAWRKKNDAFNIGSMALWLRDTMAMYAPQTYDRTFDASDPYRGLGAFRPSAGVPPEVAAGGARTQSVVHFTDRILEGVVGIEGGRDSGAADGVRSSLRADDPDGGGLVEPVLYSIADGYTDSELKQDVLDFIRRPRADYVKAFERLPVMQMVGNDLQIPGLSQRVVLTRKAASHIASDHPDMSNEAVARAISSLEEPRAVVVQKDAEKGAAVVFVTKYRDGAGRPVLVATRGEKSGELSVATVLTTFPRHRSADWVARALDGGDVAYADEREGGRLSQLLRRILLSSAGGGGRGGQSRMAGPNRTPKKNYTTLSSRNLELYRKGDRGWNRGKMAIEPAKDDNLGSEFSIAPEEIIGKSARGYTPEQLAYFQRVGRTKKHLTLRERTAELRKDLGLKMAQGIFDQFAPIKELNSRAYTLARLSKGVSGAIEAFLRHGKLRIVDGAFDADTSGGFIQRVAAPLNGEVDDFLWWVAARRAERLSLEDRERLFTAEDIAAGKSLASGTTGWDYEIQHGPKSGKTTRSRAEIYDDALRTFDEFNRNALDMAEQSGLIDGETRPMWEHEFYVPFYRESEEGFLGPRIKSGTIRQKAFERLKGGESKLNSDLLSNTLLNWAHLLDASAKNRAALMTAEAAVDAAAAIEADEATVRAMGRAIHKRKDVFWVMDGGRERYFLVEDPMLMAALSGLEYSGLRGPLMDALTSFKHWLTVAVTASPAFKARNLVRDSLQAVAVSDLSANPLRNVVAGYRAGDRAGQDYVSALASGALIRFGTMLEGKESDRVRQLTKQGMKDSHLLDSEGKVRAFYDKFLEPAIAAYNELGNRGEEINRMALYKQLLSQGVDKATAALMARDLMDFSMQGTWASIRFLTQIVPFMNARLQGLYKLGRGAKENPRRFAAVVGAAALASIALLAAYSDDDDWKKREEWDRDNYWWFKFGGTAFRIPKPFEVGAIATLAERGFEFFTDPEMTGGRLSKVTMKMIGNQLSMNPVPQAVKPILDLYANKDSFSGRPIETMGMEKLQSDYRYTMNTSMAARAIGSLGKGALDAAGLSKVGVEFLSPVQIDHLVKGYFAWLGTSIVAATDAVARPLSGQPQRPAGDWMKSLTGGFFADLPAPQSRYVTQLYEQARAVEEAYMTYRGLLKSGKAEEAREFYDENRDEIARYKRTKGATAALSRINQQIRMIEISKMAAAEKRDRIQLLQGRKDQLARMSMMGS